MLWAGSLAQGQTSRPAVQAELVADAASLVPGGSVRVGALLRVPAGWHVYWLNPGDAGAATRVEGVWPTGFIGGQFQFPVPMRFEQPGEIVGYGYEEEVLLAATLKAPGDLKPGTTVDLKINVSWLACKDVCVPGRAGLSLPMQVTSESKPANVRMFRTWLRRVPQPHDTPEGPAERVQVSQSLEDDASRFEIRIDWRQPVRDVEWFPGPDPALEISDIRTTTEDRRSRITFRTRVLPGQQTKDLVPASVVAYSDGQGERRGISIPAQPQTATPAK
jgi:DsbC/DsbD-like thiol-disulfide interchange protein